MTAPRFLPAGDAALLLELDTLDAVLAVFRVAQADQLAGVEDLVPAARTLLVTFKPDQAAPQAVVRWLRGCLKAAAGAEASAGGVAGRLVDIPVRYDGEDLDEVADGLGMTRAEVIRRHTGCDFQAAFAGFAPGFVYLTGGDPCFHGLPRRPSPRTRVPAGSVAAAGEFSAVYPSDSPGGWQLLGITPARMWDLDRAESALVQPGCRVRFHDLDAPRVVVGPASAKQAAATPESVMTPAVRPAVSGGLAEGRSVAPSDGATASWLEVRKTGLQTLFQDLGRPGLTGMGVSRSGALDREATRQANRLVGNAPDAAVLENALGGLQLVCHGRAVVAVTGAQAPVSLTTAAGVRLPAAAHCALTLEDGQVLRIGQTRAGVRCYVAVQGGWDVEPVLGSRAADVLAGIGPAPIRTGDRLTVGRFAEAGGARLASGLADGASAMQSGEWTAWDASAAPDRLPTPGDTVTVDVVLGPRRDWFDASAQDFLLSQAWRVTPQSNRVGMRLAGDRALARSKTQELPSEGTVVGAIQVPADGQPVLFLADHPLTGGYPVIAVVLSTQLDRLAQVPVGASLRFRPVPDPLRAPG